MISGIYKITNIMNKKIYIGQSVNIKRRLNKHKSQLLIGKHENKHLQASYNKYGLSAFTFEPILYCDKSLLKQYEEDLIWLSDSYTREIGYNKTLGGDGGKGYQISEETRLKMRTSRLAYKQSRETIEKTAAANRGKKREMSLEHIEKIRNFNKIPKSAETKLKMSISAKNRHAKNRNKGI